MSRWLMSRRTLYLFSLVVLGLATLGGCSGKAATAQIKGKVLMKDGTVPKGGVCVVRFQPTKESTAEIRKGASGTIGPDGSFEMYTRMPGDGVYLGDYTVTFAVWKGPMNPVSLIAQKYADPSLTPYKITVDGDVDDLSYEIEPLPGAAAATAPRATPAATPGAG